MFQDTMWQDFAYFAERYRALTTDERDDICNDCFGEPHSPAHTQGEAACLFEEIMRGNVDIDYLRAYFGNSGKDKQQ